MRVSFVILKGYGDVICFGRFRLRHVSARAVVLNLDSLGPRVSGTFLSGTYLFCRLLNERVTRGTI